MSGKIDDNTGYAAALVAMSQAEGVLDRVELQVVDLLAMLEENTDICSFMSDPLVTIEGKSAGLRDLLGDRVHPVLIHYLSLLAEQAKFMRFNDIAHEFLAMVSSTREKVSGTLIAVVQPEPGQLESIEREVSRIISRDVKLYVKLDPEIIGGAMVRVADFVLDGTVRRELDDMRLALME